MSWRLAWLVSLLLLAGCDSAGVSNPPALQADATAFAGPYPIQGVATVGMVADVVRSVGGEHVQLTQLMGPGVDPHLYMATRDDVSTIMEGDIVFYSGLMLEGKMADTLVKVARTKPVFAVTELIDPRELLEPEDFAGHYDPHVWMDVSAWSTCALAVANALGEFDPTHAGDYEKNAAAYRQQLAELHQYGLKSIATIPEGSRVLITSHDAFNYFGRAYGLEVQGVQGISTESEAGLQRINELVAMIVAKKVKAVFVESSVPRKNIDALVEGAQSKGHDVVIGGELFSDAMGQSGTYEGTYVGMLDHNITLVTRALGGEAPEAGFQGKLSSLAGAKP
ncbi:MAG TPA: zinc ABC transporter substrate-binding protein [Pirellulaceae bacterium]|nr:zinc ABC transporter substrate-binding protein [Pirellulaceae bacterium]